MMKRVPKTPSKPVRKPVSKTLPKPEQIQIKTVPPVLKIGIAPDSHASEHALLKIASLLGYKDLVDASSGRVSSKVKSSLGALKIYDTNSQIVLSNLKQARRLLQDGKLSRELLSNTSFHLVGEDGRLGREDRQSKIEQIFKENGVMQEYLSNFTDEKFLQLVEKAKKNVFGKSNPYARPTSEEKSHLRTSDLTPSHLEPFFTARFAQFKETMRLITEAKKKVFGTTRVMPNEFNRIAALKLGTDLNAYVAHFDKLKRALNQAKQARSKARK